jgi:hypothetical protein
MKRIIRLTESDLTRIVKRVIEESDEKPTMKVRMYNKFGSTERGANLDLSNMKLRNNEVSFDFKVAGGGSTTQIASSEEMWTFKTGVGSYRCDNAKKMINIYTDKFERRNVKTGKKTMDDGGGTVGYLSEKGASKIENKFCSSYASIDNEPSDDFNYA